MKRYESYKDSGVKWLGEIPGHWEVLPLKYIFKLQKKLVGRNSNKYKLLSLTLQGIKVRDLENPTGKFPSSFDSYQIVEPGDFIFCNFDNEETPRAVGQSKFKGMITGAYDVFGVNNNNMDSNYLLYYCLYIDDAKRFKPLYKGLRKTIPFDSFMSYKIAIPPKAEQTAIANYLDSVTSKIDEAISQQQKMIDLLNERKQIIIQNAVTKGLDPNAKMKDSGVEWIGEIPEDWEVRRLRNYLRIFSEKGYSHCQLLSVTREMGVILRDKENIEENHNFVPDDLSGYKHINKGDFVINKMKSWQGSYGLSDYEGIVSPAYFTCKLSGIDKKYFSTAIRSKAYIGFFNRYSKGIRLGQWDLDPLSMKEIPFIEPPLIDQQKIYNYLSEINKVINIEIEKCNKMISLLQERKQIIINDVVTGKVKVI